MIYANNFSNSPSPLNTKIVKCNNIFVQLNRLNVKVAIYHLRTRRLTLLLSILVAFHLSLYLGLFSVSYWKLNLMLSASKILILRKNIKVQERCLSKNEKKLITINSNVSIDQSKALKVEMWRKYGFPVLPVYEFSKIYILGNFDILTSSIDLMGEFFLPVRAYSNASWMGSWRLFFFGKGNHTQNICCYIRVINQHYFVRNT